ncbi:hypothetical protein TELCIR_07038 [Teladorsagia circumcincta]|uniref:Cytochrome b561 domain-containing protein n=1 Tax=Teladorsagia circumcincta TaxID=45464 RepID=A0A2G9UMX1_TELCI|nr:hypothetical protein TELCIR_07038 [Teladorsagia circumcincta]
MIEDPVDVSKGPVDRVGDDGKPSAILTPTAGAQLEERSYGILMVLSWSIFISTAILFARHMKGHWPNSALCGLQLWFHFHRTLNIIGIAGTIAGFVVVFVAKDWRWVGPKAYQSSELNNQWGSVHAMLGLIACVVAWAQPLNAVFRCHPEGKGRFLFNIIHGFFGFGCWLCAAAATMIAVVHFRMFSDRDAALGIYIAFVAVAGLTCIVMELLTFRNWWAGRHRVSGEIEMVRVGGTTTAVYTDSIQKFDTYSGSEGTFPCTFQLWNARDRAYLPVGTAYHCDEKFLYIYETVTKYQKLPRTQQANFSNACTTRRVTQVTILALIFIDAVFARFNSAECGVMKGCLFHPNNCNVTEDCKFAFSFQSEGRYLNMEISGKPAFQNGYIAVGFSLDDTMDSSSQKVTLFTSTKPKKLNSYIPKRILPTARP